MSLAGGAVVVHSESGADDECAHMRAASSVFHASYSSYTPLTRLSCKCLSRLLLVLHASYSPSIRLAGGAVVHLAAGAEDEGAQRRAAAERSLGGGEKEGSARRGEGGSRGIPGGGGGGWRRSGGEGRVEVPFAYLSLTLVSRVDALLLGNIYIAETNM